MFVARRRRVGLGRDRRCRAQRYRGPRLIARLPALGVSYRGGARGPMFAALLAAGAGTVAGMFLGPIAATAVVTLVVLGWLGWSLRLLKLTAGGAPPPLGGGTAGAREPRRPQPRPPAGAVALAVPIEPPDEAVAFA